MPEVPHLEEVILLRVAAGEATDPVTVVAFVTNAIIEVPGTDYTVKDLARQGR
jgi:hypothetical protein